MQAPVEDKVALKEIHDTVRQYYELINSAFTFYPTGTSADVFHMGLNNFTAMLEDCKVITAKLACQLSLQPWHIILSRWSPSSYQMCCDNLYRM